MHKVSLIKCPDYQKENLKKALTEALAPFGGLSNFIKPKQKVFLKLNLVIRKSPDFAATTEPALIEVLAEEIIKLGATPILGDSPGGPFNKAFLKKIYQTCGIADIAEKTGAILNYDCREATLPNPDGHLLKQITVCQALLDADVIISLPRLKTHGMTLYTGGVKNMFGSIPGLKKAQYHFSMPELADFSELLVDICSFVKPDLTIMDGIIGMEGNGPTGGNPRKIGALLASPSPYDLDVVGCQLIGLKPEEITTIKASLERNLCTLSPEIIGSTIEELAVNDFQLPSRFKSINFLANWPLPKSWKDFLMRNMTSRPVFLEDKCRKCQDCIKHCPPKALVMGTNTPKVDLKKCIRCYCCQELCRYEAIKVRSSLFL